MDLKSFKKWLNELPQEFDEYNVVCSEEGILTTNKNYRLDKPILLCDVDQASGEVLLFNKIIKKEETKWIL
jgi:hypothetical protein